MLQFDHSTILATEMSLKQENKKMKAKIISLKESESKFGEEETSGREEDASWP